MEQRSSTDSLSLRERIRSLGFDPEQLTPDEQVELLTLHISLQPGPSDGDAPGAGATAHDSHGLQPKPRAPTRTDEPSISTLRDPEASTS